MVRVSALAQLTENASAASVLLTAQNIEMRITISPLTMAESLPDPLQPPPLELRERQINGVPIYWSS